MNEIESVLVDYEIGGSPPKRGSNWQPVLDLVMALEGMPSEWVALRFKTAVITAAAARYFSGWANNSEYDLNWRFQVSYPKSHDDCVLWVRKVPCEPEALDE